jgi:hypothetical protein
MVCSGDRVGINACTLLCYHNELNQYLADFLVKKISADMKAHIDAFIILKHKIT